MATDQKINIVMAKALGWKEIDEENLCGRPPKQFNNTDKVLWSCDRPRVAWLPLYTTDLNACHEFEKALTCVETREYLYTLERVTKGHAMAFVTVSQAMHVALLVHASASQRCEAFLKVKGLWK